MNNPPAIATSRRQFLKTTGRLAAASALSGVAIPYVHAAAGDAIQLALVGCGGRGTGAAKDALSVKNGPIKLVAMADLFADRLNSSYRTLAQDRAVGSLVEVPPERKFLDFDAYKHAIDCLKPGDVVLLTTPPAFRWVHFSYAIEKGINVFMEKPVTVDGPTTRRMLQLAEAAKAKNLKVGVGLMCRHCAARHALTERMHDDIGDVLALQCYRMHPAVGTCFEPRKPANVSENEYQIRNFHSFIWASGGLFNDFYIHHIDECCWAKNPAAPTWPVKAQALGGRHYRGDKVDQNFDVYSVEYTFADGAKLFLNGRTMNGCEERFCSYALGAKGMAVICANNHSPAHCATYKSHLQRAEDLIWAFPQPEPNPYQLEWNDLIDAIRNDKPCNEVARGAQASLVCNMGRMAAHTGRPVDWDQMLNHPHELAPTADRLTLSGPAPLLADADGLYPLPQPGKVIQTEYPV
jgi:predicted dehydrogenase